MEEKEFDNINVIPFIDIMLVLLTIVLTTSTFIAPGAIPMELPQVSDQQAGTLRSISVEIDQGRPLPQCKTRVSLLALRMKSRRSSRIRRS